MMHWRKGLLGVGVLAALLSGSMGYAEERDLAYWNNYDPIIPEKGEFTSTHPVGSRIVTAPVRVVTTVGGTAIGALVGTGKGIVHAEKVVSQNTFERMPDEYGLALGPAGVIGSILAIPVGAVNGLARGAMQGTISGFMVPEGF